MYSYIIVRVPETETSQNAGKVRKLLHDISHETGIPVADNLIKKDRTYIWGNEMPYAEAEALFKKVMPDG